MNSEFGDLLREWREGRMTMGQLARDLGVHLSYLSAVERGHRPPLSSERIAIVAKLLGKPADELHAAAVRSRGAFKLSARNVSERHARVGAALARGWEMLTEDQLVQIERALTEEEA